MPAHGHTRRLHDLDVKQVLQLLPHALRRRMFRIAQPPGIHDRRPGGEKVKDDCAKEAAKLHTAQEISTTAMGYLTGWARGTRPRHPRPAQYRFSSHRWAPEPRGRGHQGEPGRGAERVSRVRVKVVGVSGEELPDEPESEDDAPLVGVLMQ